MRGAHHHHDDDATAYHSSDAEDADDDPRMCLPGEEAWADYHSEFLAALYDRLKDHVASMGVYVLDRATFPDFVDFCYTFSSGLKPPC